MKRLGVLISILVILFSVTTVFTAPEKAHAQQDLSGTIQSTATSLFINPKRALQTGLSGATSAEDRATYQALLSTLSRAEESFVLNFSESAKNLSTEAAYSAAINAALGIIVNEASSNAVLRRPIATNFINSVRAQFTAESSNREYLRAITTGTAISTNSQNLANAVLNAGGVTTAKNVETPGKCAISFTGTFSFLDCVNELITWFIKTILLNIAGFFLWVSANMLNTAIQMSILEFKSWAPDALYPIWITIRQIISLCVVFAGLWLGFMYIIDRGDAFAKYIPWVILFALFVNFSYPIARTLVDISNVISLNIYTSAVGGDSLGASSAAMSTSSNAGSLIMSRLGLQDLVVSATSPANTTGNMLGQINSMPGALLAVIFVFYAAFVFFMATAIIVIRSAVLVFLIIASPLLLVDSVIPKLGDAAAKLRKAFFEQLVVAPVFMLMFALTLKFLEVFRTGSGPLSAGSGENIKVFFNILMMLVMLHIMLKVTKSVSGSAGQFATNALGKVGGFGLGVATGGAGFLARGTMGRVAAVARDSKWVTNNQDKMLGRGVYGLTNSLAKSSYDARNVTSISSTMGKAGIPLGKGVATTYEKDLANRAADRKSRYERIQTSYKEDEFDRLGNITHRAGDVQEDGVRAANRFRRNEGGLSNTLLGKTNSFIFNKQPLGKELAAIDLKDSEKRESEKDKAATVFLKEYAAQKTTEGKTNYLNDLRRDLAQTKTTDPALVGTHAKALVEGIRKIEEGYGQEIRTIEQKNLETLATYTKSDVMNRIQLQNDAKNNPALKEKMGTLDEYLAAGVNKDGVDTSTTQETIDKKVAALVKLNDSDAAKKVIENDTFRGLQDTQKKEVEKMQEDLDSMEIASENPDKKEAEKETKELKIKYDVARVALAKKKIEQREQLESLRNNLLTQYQEKAGVRPIAETLSTTPTDIDITGESPDWKVTREQLQRNPNAINIPAYQRKDAAASPSTSTTQRPGDAPAPTVVTPPQVPPTPPVDQQVAVDISGENTDWGQTAGLRPNNPVATATNPAPKVPAPTSANTVPPNTQPAVATATQSNQPVNTNVVSLADMIKRRNEAKSHPVSA